MTREAIYTMIQSIGLPCAYYQFADNTPQAPPFVCWFFSVNTDAFAENENYVDKEVLNIELYTSYRDFDTEKAIESILANNGFTYAKEPAFVDAEKIWQISYESEVIIDGEQQG